MYIDLSNFPKNLFCNEDIIINDIKTYPQKLVDFLVSKKYNEDDLQNFFYENRNYNVLGVHFTRLTNYEIQDIIQNGLRSDNSFDYERKIQNLPKEFDQYKSSLKQFAATNRRSENNIYFDVGKIELKHGITVFLKNWGGETIYCYYDNQFHNKPSDLINLGNRLRRCSTPCIVIVRVDAYDFFVHFSENKGLTQSMKTNCLMNYSHEIWLDKTLVNVVAVYPIKNIIKFLVRDK